MEWKWDPQAIWIRGSLNDYGVIVISSQSKEPKVPTAQLLQLEYNNTGSAKGLPVSSKNLLYDSAYPLSNTQKVPSAPLNFIGSIADPTWATNYLS